METSIKIRKEVCTRSERDIITSLIFNILPIRVVKLYESFIGTNKLIRV